MEQKLEVPTEALSTSFCGNICANFAELADDAIGRELQDEANDCIGGTAPAAGVAGARALAPGLRAPVKLAPTEPLDGADIEWP